MPHQNVWTQNKVLKTTMIHQYKIELQERIKNQEKENKYFFKRDLRENNEKFIQNSMRRKKVKIKNIVINTKLSKSCYVIIK